MPFSLTTLRKINVDRNSRQQKLSQIVSLLNMTAKSYFETLINYDQNSKTYVPGCSCSCMKSLSDKFSTCTDTNKKLEKL